MEVVKVADSLLVYGPLGVIAVLLIGAVIKLFLQLTAERKEHSKEMRDLEDRYISKAETWVAKYQDLAQAQDATIKALRDLVEDRHRT